MKNVYSGPNTDTPTNKKDCYPKIMRQKVALHKLVTLAPYTQIRTKPVTKTYGLIHVKPMHTL